jgi:dTDP-4-amino-4,6-dideoxygalactose transaminase
MTIPQFQVFMADDVDDYVSPVLRSGYISQGKKVEEFESKLSEFLGFRYGLTVNSGTSALMLALRLAGAKPGTNVVSTPMTCSATNEAIALMGADIVWADVDEYGNIDPNDVARKINSRTVAVMAVDWGGLPCNYEGLRWAASSVTEKAIPIIEDAAHAFGASYQGDSIAISGGDYVCYSFQAIKHLTSGDGGLVVCPDEESYERGKLLRWFGLDRTSSDAMRSRQDIKEVGYKFHMNDINASIGLANINHIPDILEKHRANAEYYDNFLSRLRPPWPNDRRSSFWLYTIHLKSPERFEEWAKNKGVVASQVHMRNDKYNCFWPFKTLPLVGLDKFSETMMCIPVGWWLTEQDLDWIIEVVTEWTRINR